VGTSKHASASVAAYSKSGMQQKNGQSDSTRATFLLRLRDRKDEITWQRFHKRYGELLYRYARSRGASVVDAEDIVQDVEMALFKALDGFEYDGTKGQRGQTRACG
jgi:hypothetical protein